MRGLDLLGVGALIPSILFAGTVLAVLTAMGKGGASMYSIAWPISGLFMLCLAAVLGEMASTWPVAGTWKGSEAALSRLTSFSQAPCSLGHFAYVEAREDWIPGRDTFPGSLAHSCCVPTSCSR